MYKIILIYIYYKYILFLYISDAAWLSSARVVKCLVNSFNERNPLFYN